MTVYNPCKATGSGSWVGNQFGFHSKRSKSGERHPCKSLDTGAFLSIILVLGGRKEEHWGLLPSLDRTVISSFRERPCPKEKSDHLHSASACMHMHITHTHHKTNLKPIKKKKNSKE